MFKAAFPWASLAEEEAERKYQKTFPSAGPDEVAGSVWVAPGEGERYPDCCANASLTFSLKHFNFPSNTACDCGSRLCLIPLT